MNKRFTLKASLLVAGLLALPLAHAVMSMSKADYSAAKTRIGADCKTGKAGCDRLAGDAKASCVASAKTAFGKS